MTFCRPGKKTGQTNNTDAAAGRERIHLSGEADTETERFLPAAETKQTHQAGGDLLTEKRFLLTLTRFLLTLTRFLLTEKKEHETEC